MDQVPQITVVSFNVRLAGSHTEPLFEEGAEIERDFAFLRQLVRRAGIFGNKNPDDTDAAGGADGFDEIVHGHVRDFVTGGIVTLITDTFAAAVSAQTVRKFEHTFDVGGFGIVDGDCANLLGQPQPVRVPINHHDLARALDHGGVGGHETHRSAAVDDDGVARFQAGQFRGVPTGGENV